MSYQMKKQQLQYLTESIRNLEQFVSNPLPELKQKENLHLEFNLLSTKKAERLLL